LEYQNRKNFKKKIDIKYKKYIMRMFWKIAIPLFLSLLIIVGVFIFTKSSQQHKPSQKEFCDQFSDNVKMMCRDSTEKCEAMPHEMGFWSCLAIDLIKIDVEAAKKACEQLNDSDDQKFCFADALDEIDIEAAKTQCNLINNTDARITCNANIFKKINLTQALKNCEEFESPDQIYICKALVSAPQGGDKAKLWCEKIVNIEMKFRCFNMVKGY
jgi:hypothetical protein